MLVDSSGLYAIADEDDQNHTAAVAGLGRLLQRGEDLLIHNYVLVEVAALLQRRVSLDAALSVLRPHEGFRMHWVADVEHGEAVALLANRGRRRLSFVDCVSFVVMRRLGIRQAFAFDRDFEAEGFSIYP